MAVMAVMVAAVVFLLLADSCKSGAWENILGVLLQKADTDKPATGILLYLPFGVSIVALESSAQW